MGLPQLRPRRHDRHHGGLQGARPARKAPAYLLAAFRRNRKALAVFEGFPPDRGREYVEWVVEAKTAETRERRIAQAVEWMAQGTSRHWKYR